MAGCQTPWSRVNVEGLPLCDNKTMFYRQTVQYWELGKLGREDLIKLTNCLMPCSYRVFFFLWIQSGGCKSAIFGSFKQFLYFLRSKIWAHFHFGTFEPYKQQKS